MTDLRPQLIGLLGATARVALTLATLLPTNWIPRTGLGWETEHFIVYFSATFVLSVASRRPYVVAIALMIFAGILEACQGLTPERFPDVTAALSGAAGVIFAVAWVVVLMRARRRLPIRMPGVLSAIAPIAFPLVAAGAAVYPETSVFQPVMSR